MAFRREYGLVGKHIEFVKEDGNLYSAVMKALHYAD